MRRREGYQIGLIHNRSGPKTMAIEEDEHMASNVKELMDSANAVVPRITPEEARKLIANNGLKLNDVTITDARLTVDASALNADGVLKLSSGKKKHVLVKPA